MTLETLSFILYILFLIVFLCFVYLFSTMKYVKINSDKVWEHIIRINSLERQVGYLQRDIDRLEKKSKD